MNNFIFPFHMIPNGSHIILYGAGTIGAVFFKQLMATKYAEIVLWVDKNYLSYKKQQYPVASVDEIVNVENIDYIVIANNKIDAIKDIENMLVKQYAFKMEQIICPYENYDFPAFDLFFVEQDGYEVRNAQELYQHFEQKYIKEHGIKKVEPWHLYDIKSLFRRRYQPGGDEIAVIAKKKEIATRDLFLAQYYKGDYSEYKFYDAAVRMLAIDEHFGKNKVGFDMYRRMQADSGFDWTERFKQLIKSVEEQGVLNENTIEVDKNFAILDGAHRITLSLSKGIEFLYTSIYDCDRVRPGMDVFWEKGFTADECNMIKSTTQKLLSEATYDFVGVLWPPVKQYFDDIINDIGQYNLDEIHVLDYCDYTMDKGEFEHLFKALYHTDILSEDGMNRKIKLIEDCMTSFDAGYPIRVFYLHIDHPMIGLNPKNYTPQSQVIKHIKNVFRNRYRNKLNKYEYDVIMHISDNYLQSKFCSILFQLNYDISEFFNEIKNWNYVILRAKESRQHKLFPKKIYLRSNSDILVLDNTEREKLAELAFSFLTKHFKNEWVTVRKELHGDSIYVAAYLRDFLIYQFEFMSHIYALSDNFSKECMKDIIKEDINYLSDTNEIIIRLLEYIHKPKKKWYLPYLKQNIEKLDKDRLFKHLDTSIISKEEIEKMCLTLLE